MGVNHLWNILNDVSEKKPLSYLCGKRVAVDLSGWVVQAEKTRGLQSSQYPYLRNLFFRVSYLLKKGVHPIFVLEGKPPDLKANTIRERKAQWQPHAKCNSFSNNVTRKALDRILAQCKDLLESLGVPCVKSSGEAEAFCAFLCCKGIVDGVITDDNDAFLYGADPVFQEFTIDRKDPHIKVYSLKSEGNNLNLDRSKLVALALLLGCDYCEGVKGIGEKAATKFIAEVGDQDLLQRFKDWKEKSLTELFSHYKENAIPKKPHCTHCSHIGSSLAHKKEGCTMCGSNVGCGEDEDLRTLCSCEWHSNEAVALKHKYEIKIYNSVKEMPDFPNLEVIDEYMNFSGMVPDENCLKLRCPNLSEFQDKADKYLHWSKEKSCKKCLPLITSWQLYGASRKQICHQELPLLAVKILKKHTVQGESLLQVQWELSGNQLPNLLENQNLVTSENADLMKESYPEIIQSYLDLQKKPKRKSTPKSKVKSVKVPDQASKVNSVTEMNADFQSLDLSCLSPQKILDRSSDSFMDLPLQERIKMLSIGMKNPFSTKECTDSHQNMSEGNSRIPSTASSHFVSEKENTPCYSKSSILCPRNLQTANNDKRLLCLDFSESEDESFLDLLENLNLDGSVDRKHLVENKVSNVLCNTNDIHANKTSASFLTVQDSNEYVEESKSSLQSPYQEKNYLSQKMFLNTTSQLTPELSPPLERSFYDVLAKTKTLSNNTFLPNKNLSQSLLYSASQSTPKRDEYRNANLPVCDLVTPVKYSLHLPEITPFGYGNKKHASIFNDSISRRIFSPVLFDSSMENSML